MPPGIGSPVLESEAKLCRSSRPVNSSSWSPACSATWRKARRTLAASRGVGVRDDVELVEGLLPGAQHDAEVGVAAPVTGLGRLPTTSKNAATTFGSAQPPAQRVPRAADQLPGPASAMPTLARPRYGWNPAHHRSGASESADRRRRSWLRCGHARSAVGSRE